MRLKVAGVYAWTLKKEKTSRETECRLSKTTDDDVLSQVYLTALHSGDGSMSSPPGPHRCCRVDAPCSDRHSGT